jgi:hypothetical protein
VLARRLQLLARHGVRHGALHAPRHQEQR